MSDETEGFYPVTPIIRKIEPSEVEWFICRAAPCDPIQGPAVIDEKGRRIGQLVCILRGSTQSYSSL